jgi:MerR family transcriptional regulator, light-induced transcriptional regulator
MENERAQADDFSEECPKLGLYPIRVVAKQTGIGVHTLRAWERRYGLPRPSRSAGTHRLYGIEDIALLRRVQHLILSGTPPGRACAYVMSESEHVPIQPEEEHEQPAVDFHDSTLRGPLVKAFTELCEECANRILSEAFHLLGPEFALTEVVLPALADIGQAWAEGRASIAAEHFGSGLIRARLLSAFEGGSRGEHQPVALIGSGPKEQHEIPGMVLALLLRRRGWRAMYLGSCIPYDALEDAIVRKRPNLVCLSSTTDATVPALFDVLAQARCLPECASTTLAYGGLPFKNDPGMRSCLDGIATYLGDDLLSAADFASTLVDHAPGVLAGSVS